MAAKKKKEVSLSSAALSPVEALELRLLEFQVSVTQAAHEKAIALRNAQAIAIAKAHDIDITQGNWHIDADAGRIAPLRNG